jgi:hypothetical protein
MFLISESAIQQNMYQSLHSLLEFQWVCNAKNVAFYSSVADCGSQNRHQKDNAREKLHTVTLLSIFFVLVMSTEDSLPTAHQEDASDQEKHGSYTSADRSCHNRDLRTNTFCRQQIDSTTNLYEFKTSTRTRVKF